jgi:zinc transporter ZupT
MKTELALREFIASHNFPEGLVVISAVIGGDITLGIIVAIAIGLHNIPGRNKCVCSDLWGL